MLGKIRSGDHRMVRCKIRLDLKRERGKLAKSRKPNIGSLRARTQEFKIPVQNKFALLTGDEVRVDVLNNNLKTVITESAIAVGEVELGRKTGQLSKQTKDLIAKCQNMKLSRVVDQIALAVLSI